MTTRNQQVARIDYENDEEIDGQMEDALADLIDARLEGVGAIVVSDYFKGVVTRRLMAQIVASAESSGIPVLVDPKIPHLEEPRPARRWSRRTIMRPRSRRTCACARRATRRKRPRRSARARKCEGVLITRGEHGMWLSHGEAAGHLPAAAREVADVTGAGDTVVATLALAIAAGATWVEAARLANEAAGIVVGKFGPATVTPEELVSRFP